MGSDDLELPSYERVAVVLLECLGTMGEGLWRVSLRFKDGTNKPEGIFADPAMARAAAEELANSWDCELKESS